MPQAPPFVIDAMKIFYWVLRLAIFLLLFLFAAHNTEQVLLRFFLGQAWQAPLVVVLLIFFAAGAILGMSSLLGLIFRLRREIQSLKKQNAAMTANSEHNRVA